MNNDVRIMAIDLVKSSFQVCAVTIEGAARRFLERAL